MALLKVFTSVSVPYTVHKNLFHRREEWIVFDVQFLGKHGKIPLLEYPQKSRQEL